MPRSVSPAELRELLRYDPETGKLYWLPRTPAQFSYLDRPETHCPKWNGQFAGKEALYGLTDTHGYPAGAIFNRQYLAHRVIWALVYGEWPPAEIDHIDGDKTNNRLSNLRSVTRATNMRNRKLGTDNRSGVMGVHWAKHAHKWRAEIKSDGKRVHLGYFDDKAAARAARRDAEPALGFHPNHGQRP